MLIETILRDKGGEVITLPDTTTLHAAAKILDERKIGAIVAVSESGGVAGVLSERDICRRVARHGADALKMTVADAMTRDVITIGLQESLQDGLERMTDRRIRHLPVVDGSGKLVGLVSIGDLVKWKIAETEAEAEALKSYLAG